MNTSSILARTELWRFLRERKILSTHRKVAGLCDDLIRECGDSPVPTEPLPLQDLGTDKVIWQYWAQGFENAPGIVKDCIASVDKFAQGWKIIRLSDENIGEYIEIPQAISRKRGHYSLVHFSDLLRLMLLHAYGGFWMDATIMLTGPIPQEYTSGDFFVFRRDPSERNIKYWRNTYAYYFGWAKGFRVNMLTSFMFARKDSPTLGAMYKLLYRWWQTHDALPDYFFLQILFDCIGTLEQYPLVSDCLPHYLQQSMNDPHFKLMSKEDITRTIPVHKLSYK